MKNILSEKNFPEKERTATEKKQKLSVLYVILFAVFIPVVCYVILEIIESGTSFLTVVPPEYALFNIAYLVAGYVVLISILRSTKAVSIILLIASFAIGTVNYYTVLWRTLPVNFGDLKCAATAGSILYGYNLVIPDCVIIAAAVLALCITLVILAPTKNPPQSIKGKFMSSCAAFVIGAVTLGVCYGMTSTELDVVGSDGVHFEKYGYLVSFISNAKTMEIEEPDNYSPGEAAAILSEYETEEKAEIYPNIIIIMNESLCDLQSVGEFETNEPYLPFFNSLKEESVSGEILTFGLGGGTSLTEFELLTRSSQILLPYTSVAYMQYIDSDIPTIASTVRNYETPYEVTAMHPAQGINYNRDKNYPFMGFDRFLDLEYFADLESPRGFLDDEQCYDRMMEYFYTTDENTPQMIFNITIQNHGGFYDTCDIGTEPIEITSFEAGYDAERYLTLVKKSDDALENLVAELSECDRPVVLMVFGDHQPLLEDEFYEELRGDKKTWTDEDYISRHITPFLIWSNYGNIEPEDLGLTSVNYLSSILLDTAELPLTEYDRFLLSMREEIPAMSGCMYYTADGELHEVGDEENPWLDMYAILQYGALFDNENIDWSSYDLSSSEDVVALGKTAENSTELQ